jgi:hypothetical protein
VAKSFLLKVTCSWDAARSAGGRDAAFGFVAASPPTNSHQFAERFIRFKASENTPHPIISSDEGSGTETGSPVRTLERPLNSGHHSFVTRACAI